MSRYRALQSLLRQPPGGCGSTSGCISSSRFLASGRSVSPHVPSPSTSTNAAAGAHGGQDPAGAREWSPQMQKYLETQAYLFNEKPPAEGESRKWFYWEPSYYLVWAGLIFALVMGYRAPETIQDWARDEAEERIRRRIQGQPVEYGYNYATYVVELDTIQLSSLYVLLLTFSMFCLQIPIYEGTWQTPPARS